MGLRFKSARGRGGVVENIWIEDIAMNNILQEPLLFDLFYGGKSASEAHAEGGDAEVTDIAPKPVDEHARRLSGTSISETCGAAAPGARCISTDFRR